MVSKARLFNTRDSQAGGNKVVSITVVIKHEIHGKVRQIWVHSD